MKSNATLCRILLLFLISTLVLAIVATPVSAFWPQKDSDDDGVADKIEEECGTDPNDIDDYPSESQAKKCDDGLESKAEEDLGGYLKSGIKYLGVEGWSFLLAFGFIGLTVWFVISTGADALGHGTGAGKTYAAGVGLLIGGTTAGWLVYNGIDFWAVSPWIGLGMVVLSTILMLYKFIKGGATGISMPLSNKAIIAGIFLIVIGIAVGVFI